MLEITDYKLLTDGRLFVDTIGGVRFKVIIFYSSSSSKLTQNKILFYNVYCNVYLITQMWTKKIKKHLFLVSRLTI